MALFRHSKNTKKPLLGQILGLIPKYLLRNEIQNQQSDKGCDIKDFLGTNENAIKMHIYVALTIYLLLEPIKRFCCDSKTAFSNFCEKIRICLAHYLTLDYVCNELKPVVKKVEKPPWKTLFDRDNSDLQIKLVLLTRELRRFFCVFKKLSDGCDS